LISRPQDAGASTPILRSIRAKTIADWKGQSADPGRDRVVSSLSLLSTDWLVDLGIGLPGQSQTSRLPIFIRFVDGEPKVIGVGD